MNAQWGRWRRDMLFALVGAIAAAAVLVPVGWARLQTERQRAVAAEEAVPAERRRAEAAEEAARAERQRADTAQAAVQKSERALADQVEVARRQLYASRLQQAQAEFEKARTDEARKILKDGPGPKP